MNGMRSIALLAIFSACGSYVSARVFSIDSTRILRESREGLAILNENEKDRKELMDFEFEQSKKISTMRDEIENDMRSGKLTAENAQERYEELGRLQRKIKHEVEDSREDYKIKEQRRVVKFREKVHQVAGDYFKSEQDSVVLDKAIPGLIFVAESTDRTDTLLKELNKRFEQDKAKLALTKKTGGNKQA